MIARALGVGPDRMRLVPNAVDLAVVRQPRLARRRRAGCASAPASAPDDVAAAERGEARAQQGPPRAGRRPRIAEGPRVALGRCRRRAVPAARIEARVAANGTRRAGSVMAGRLQDAALHAWYEAASIFVHPTQYRGQLDCHARGHVAPAARRRHHRRRPARQGASTARRGGSCRPGDATALARALRTALRLRGEARYNGRRRPGAGRGGVLVGPLGRSHAGRIRRTADRGEERVTDLSNRTSAPSVSRRGCAGGRHDRRVPAAGLESRQRAFPSRSASTSRRS